LKIIIRITLAFIVLLAFCLVASRLLVPAPGVSAGPWYSIIPALVAILLAFTTRRVLLSLSLGVLAGGLLSRIPGSLMSPATWLAGLHTTGQYAGDALANVTHLQILAFLPPMFTMVAVIQVAGGFTGLMPWLLKCIKGPKSAQAATACLGIICFIDDYTNAVVVGAISQPITDRFRISREKARLFSRCHQRPHSGHGRRQHLDCL